MTDLFLIPIISVFDVHDVAVRDWLIKLDDKTLKSHLESPYGLERYFSQSARHAMKGVEEVHNEVLRLIDTIDPQAVFFDISVDLVGLENRYNKRLLSPSEFWKEYYQAGACIEDASRSVYCIYILGIIDRLIRLIENKEHLPLNVVFYGLSMKTREELIPVYENAFDTDSEFVLQMAKELNEIMNLRESPEHMWYSTMAARQTAISYEETEKFYTELLYRIRRLLKYRAREHFVRSLKDNALLFLNAYEKFLDHKIMEEEIKTSNILEGLNVLTEQSELRTVVIFCTPMNYFSLLKSLQKEKRLYEMGITLGDIEINRLVGKMKPFIQKSRIMQSNYEIALDIIGSIRPPRFDVPDAIIMPF
ncbi:MAG: hypothetical protein Q7J35_17210 [Candidatus Methanoperedens sp.]|nr:hypothetical protein [Candidatus Methanoperedens sp.]